ncbi:MAG: ROK family protein [Acutalibacteraceae bacterium]
MDNTVDISIVRKTNHKAIWDYIHKNAHASIPQISKAIGLSLPTVTRAVDFGVENGILKECEMVGGERGRRAQTYSLCPDFMHFILISVIKGGLFWRVHDFLSSTISCGEVCVDDSNFFSILDEVIDNCIAADDKISMIAISATGIIDEGRVVSSFFYPSLDGVPLKEYIEKRTGKIAIVENDMRVAAYAALSREKNAGDGVLAIYYFGENGCGAGIMIDGVVVNGAGGAAAEMDGITVTAQDDTSLDYYSQKLKALIYIINPKKIILYHNGGEVSAEMLVKEIKRDVWQHLIPEFSVREDILSDFFCGLSLLCEQEVVESIKKELF